MSGDRSAGSESGGRDQHHRGAALQFPEHTKESYEAAALQGVNVDRIKELQPLFHGEYSVILRNGTRLTLSRGYREKLDGLLGRLS